MLLAYDIKPLNQPHSASLNPFLNQASRICMYAQQIWESLQETLFFSLHYLCISLAFDQVLHLQSHLLILAKAGSTEESLQCSPAALSSTFDDLAFRYTI